MLREWILAILTSLSAEPGQVEQESPRAAAAVAVAYASLADQLPPPPLPLPAAVVSPPCPNCPAPGAKR